MHPSEFPPKEDTAILYCFRKFVAQFCESEATKRRTLTYSPLEDRAANGFSRHECLIALAAHETVNWFWEEYQEEPFNTSRRQSLDPRLPFTFDSNDPFITELEEYKAGDDKLIKALKSQCRSLSKTQKEFFEKKERAYENYLAELDKLAEQLAEQFALAPVSNPAADIWEEWMLSKHLFDSADIRERGRALLRLVVGGIPSEQDDIPIKEAAQLCQSLDWLIEMADKEGKEAAIQLGHSFFVEWQISETLPHIVGLSDSQLQLIRLLLAAKNHVSDTLDCFAAIVNDENAPFDLRTLQNHGNAITKFFKDHWIPLRVSVSKRSSMVSLTLNDTLYKDNQIKVPRSIDLVSK